MFNLDVYHEMIKYCDKDTSFFLTNSCTYLYTKLSRILYEKYVFNHDKITNNSIRKYIYKISNISVDSDDILMYPNLKTIEGRMYYFTNVYLCSNNIVEKITCLKYDRLDMADGLWSLHRFKSLRILHINVTYFNVDITGKIPSTVEILRIHSMSFQQKVDGLHDNLLELYLDCYFFNQSVDNLPRKLKILGIKSINFNKPLNNLPNGLQELVIKGHKFNQSLNKLPNTIQMLIINSIDLDKNNIDMGKLNYIKNLIIK